MGLSNGNLTIAKMNIHLLLTLLSTATASPLLPIDSSSLPDLMTDLQLDDSVSDDENVLNSNNHYPRLVGQQAQPPIISGISTTSQYTGPLPKIDTSWLDTTVQVEPSFPFSSSDIMPSGSFPVELTQNFPSAAAEKVAPVRGQRATTDDIYLCCESKGENKFVCDDRERWYTPSLSEPGFIFLFLSLWLLVSDNTQYNMLIFTHNHTFRKPTIGRLLLYSYSVLMSNRETGELKKRRGRRSISTPLYICIPSTQFFFSC